MNRKPYLQKQPANWWVKNPYYRFYMLREGTAIPLFLYSLLLLYGVYALTQGESAFNQWVAFLRSPGMIIFQLITFLAAVFHAYTWFELVPKILVLRIGNHRVPDFLIKVSHWGACIFCTVIILVSAIYFL